ncbi:MAG: DNA-binding transcriptional regulator [Verrucomicrobia bacterium]|nr:DNA-binding transcriptional regulator [Verrucomicrobiota bacterium]
MPQFPKVVLLIESSRGSGRKLLNGVARYAHYHGPWSFYWEPGGLEMVWPVLKTLEADGIIMRDGDKLEEVLALGIPAIVVGHKRREVAGLVNVVTDSLRIGRMAAEHLLQCGFRNFAYCGYATPAAENIPWSELRKEHFAARLQQAGLSVNTYSIRSTPTQNWPEERNRLAQWLASLPRPVGLMACNDDCGVQVMEACKLAGLSVPDQVGVIGADDDEIVCGLANPPMSSVAINFERAGYESAQALDHLMRGSRKVPSRITVPATHILARRSTDIVAIADVPVAKALRFIRDHARRPVSVEEVSRAAGLSRRALERRLRSETGASILDQIRRARTDQIARLLVETDLPICQIAESLGFDDVQHVARYFRAVKQMGPLAFRKAYGNQTARPVP